MDSPVRKMQKKNDYNRHKLLRKIKRKREAEKEQQLHAAEKELKKRLKQPKYGDGKVYYLDNPEQARLNPETGGWQVLDKNGQSIANEGGYMLPTLEVDPINNPDLAGIAEKNTPQLNQGEIQSTVQKLWQPVKNYFNELSWRLQHPEEGPIGGKYTMPAIALAGLMGSDAALGAIDAAVEATGIPTFMANNPITTATIGAGIEAPMYSELIQRRLINGDNSGGLLQDAMDATVGLSALSRMPTVANNAYKLTKQGLNWVNRNYVKPYRLSRAINTGINNTQITPSKMQPFINTDWYNLLMSKNGNNYYRLASTKELAGKNSPNGMFLSHTTPWEEFVGSPTGYINVRMAEETNGSPILYEFPHSTFGDLKATGYTGLQAGYNDYNVADLGRQHLLFGDTSSGARGPVRVISDKNAELLEMDPFIMGITERPLKPNGLYDANPIYEDIYNGYQTAVSPEILNNAITNSNYMLYERTPNGIQKTLHIGENPKNIQPPASIVDFNTAKTASNQQALRRIRTSLKQSK